MEIKSWMIDTLGNLWDWEIDLEEDDGGYFVRALDHTEDDEGNYGIIFKILHEDKNKRFSKEEDAWQNALEFIFNKLTNDLEIFKEMSTTIEKALETIPNKKPLNKLN